MPGRRATLFAATAVAALLAGCGDDPRLAGDRDGTLELRMDEYGFTPQDVRVDTGRLRIVAHNAGRLAHNVAVVRFKRRVAQPDAELVRTPVAPPGATVSATVTLRPGRYRLVCTLANHETLGQWGELKADRRRF